jgi:signal transduction histidine kinase/DNA-binding NarL/FixJ family response regulator
MTGTVAPEGAQPQRVWLLGVVGVLTLVLLAVGYVQWRQFKLLDTTSRFQNDALGWSFSQLETEQLRLRSQLQAYVDDAQHGGKDKVQLRYDIFVSRISLVDHERAARIMGDQPAYAPAITQVRAFVKSADIYLGEPATQALDAAAGKGLLEQLDALSTPLHDLSLGASHLLYQRATERNNAVRQQSELGIALTAFQCVLLLVLAFIVLRQLRALTERRRNLEALADSLSIARQGAEAANRAKSVFLANMSHEIRTPFHGMLGMMSLLQEGGLSPRQAAYLDIARESAQHLLTILNDILDISQLESGKLQVVPQTVDLPQLITQVDALIRVQAEEKGLDMQVDLAPDVPRWVLADPTRLKQILFNLLSNALKFTNSGAISLDVALGARGSLSFAVTDTGVGMDESTQGRLFQRFTQGDGSPSRRATGAGLGLEISRDLARLMGGDITVHSLPGQGSRFTALLPLSSVGAPTTASSDTATLAPGRFKRLRVLVAEDHPVNRAYLEAVLEKLGHEAVFKVDGDGAVRAIVEQPEGQDFDVVLMDLHMPGMDGFTAARTIRAMPPPRGRVPIVALTADAFQASRHLAREAGMDGFLTKPAHLPQLREALERYGGKTLAFALGPEAAPQMPDASAAGQVDSLLDAATMADLAQALSPGKYRELLAGFFEGSAKSIAELRHASAQAERAELVRQAHAFKGAALSLGLRRVGETAAQLQSAAPGGSPKEIAALLDELETQFGASIKEFARCGVLDLSQPRSDATSPPAPARA